MTRAPLLLFVFFLALAAPAQAQRTVEVPRNDEAELVFEQALEAFGSGDYGMAYRRFRLVYTQFPLNQKTTASLVMAGKALYRQGNYRHAAALFDEFIRAYGTSRYVPEARRMLDFIERAQAGGATQRETVSLGIALPLTARDAPLTQAFFNGLRMAVDEHNAGQQGPRVQMVFRDTRNDEARARAVIGELRDAAVVVGPLYSEEALAAAAAAEQAQVTLVAPLATDPRVSQGRRYVFQANATTEVRGRTMARYALSSMRARRFGIFYESGADRLSAEMAEAFGDEVMREGGQVLFYTEVPSRGGWAQIDEQVESGAFAGIDALYLPVAGSNADSDIRGALTALGRTGAMPRVLGNTEWHRRGDPEVASRYGATYTNDFYPDEGIDAVRQFRQRYEARTGDALAQQPFVQQRLAFTGYDLGRFLLQQLGTPGSMHDALRRASRYNGLGINLDFRSGNVNDALFINRYRAGNIEIVR